MTCLPVKAGANIKWGYFPDFNRLILKLSFQNTFQKIIKESHTFAVKFKRIKMTKNWAILCIVLLVTVFSVPQIRAQSFIKKMKEKAENEAVNKIFGTDNKNQTETPQTEAQQSETSERPANTKGEGLSAVAPDVLENIGDAEGAFGDKMYSSARFSVRQAILGIELEIGKKVLNGLPEKVEGLGCVKEEDQVTSTGIGFIGLVIERVYRQDDQQFNVTIGNDAGLLSAASLYLTAGTYGTTSDQNIKQTKFKGYRAVIEFDEYSGYKLSIPFGQSSVLVMDGINFENEAAIMKAAENIDIEKIKTQLGEQ